MPTINGQFPGPTLYATLGDQVEIIVKNDMDNTNTSIHYHGIRQIGSTKSDGVPGVTQDSIQPGNSYTQRFLLTQAGTYFYHAHVGLQDDSVQGAFVVYESPEANPLEKKNKLEKQCKKSLRAGPYNYKKDLILQLSEWWHDELDSRQDYYMGSAFKFDHGANSILMNGNSIYSPLKANQLKCDGYTTFDVEPNSVYRLRVIGGNSFRTLALGIVNHNMTIIEVDGELVHPYNTSFLEVTPGQRFSVLLKTGDYLPGETFAIGTGYLWRQKGRGMTETGYGYVRYVKKDTDSNHSQLFKPLSRWFEPKKAKGKHSWKRREKKNGSIEIHGSQPSEKKIGKLQVHGKQFQKDTHKRPNKIENHSRILARKDDQPNIISQFSLDDENRQKSSTRHTSNAPPGHGSHSRAGVNNNYQSGHHGGGHQEYREYPDLPSFPKRDIVDWIWHELRPLADRDPILDETHVRTIRLHTALTYLADNTTRYMVNNRMSPERHSPAIEHYSHSHMKKRSVDVYDDQFYTDLHTYRLGYNETVDFVFQNTLNKGGGCMLHPWHTHGHSHYVIASGPGEYVHDLHQGIRNFKYPLYKDTTVAYPSYSHGGVTDGCGWTKVRIKADNPGFWAVHCHITTHMMQGKMIVLEEAPDMIEETSLY